MEIGVILSIKLDFAAAIFTGRKRYEFRRVIFKNMDVKIVYVYATKPVGLIIGKFEIENIVTDEPESLWGITKDFAGITKEYFDDYFDGRDIAHALKVGIAHLYDRPQSLMEMFDITRPPQSFMYV